MNGLRIIDLEEANFMDRLLKREPRENAFLEVNNLLATVPILKLDIDSIQKILEKHEIPIEKARSRLTHFYAIVLRSFVLDFDISESQFEELKHLQNILTIDSKEIGSIHAAILYPMYQQYVRQAVSDGKLSEQDKSLLNRVSEQLRIPSEFAKKLYKNEAEMYLHSKLKQSIANGMLSSDEENELIEIAKNLEIELQLSENAKRNLQRHRYLWQLSVGNLPTVESDLFLENGEVCSVILNAEMFDIGNVYEPIKFSGYETKQQNSMTGFHSGMVRTNRLQGEVMRFLSSGMLYFTDRRLIFNNSSGVKKFLLSDLIGATFYPNGMLVEQQDERDKFLKFSGDMEAIKLMFNSLMTKSRGN